MIGMTKPSEAQLQLMTDGMQLLDGVLSNVAMGIGHAR